MTKKPSKKKPAKSLTTREAVKRLFPKTVRAAVRREVREPAGVHGEEE